MTKSSINKKILAKAYGDFSRPLVSYAISKVNNTALSDDLVQTTFMKTWAYLQKRGQIDLMRAFPYHTLNKLIIDEYRKHKSLSLDQLTENGFEFGSDGLQKMNTIIDGETAASFIKKLPEKYCAVINMRFFDDLSLKEISDRTHQSENAVSVQVHRALIKLRVLYCQGTVFA